MALDRAWAVRAGGPLLALALASCGAGPERIDPLGFCEALVEVQCSGLQRCCGAQGGGVDGARCRTETFEACYLRILTADDRGDAPSGPSAPARIVFDFDEVGAAAALERLRGDYAGCAGDPPPPLFGATHILGEPGAECLSHAHCVEGTRCEHPPLAVFGTCVLAPLAGAPCTDVCAARELSCLQDSSGASVCVAPRREGETCALAPCAKGLRCADEPGRAAVCTRDGAAVDPVRERQAFCEARSAL